jgi:hypothetical protein
MRELDEKKRGYEKSRKPMRKMEILGSALLTVFTASFCLAQALDVDWKCYGFATFSNVSQICFYDAKGVVKQPDAHLRVWTKCLSQLDMDNFDPKTELGKKVIDTAARKVIDAYIPPIAAVTDFEYDQVVTIIGYEVTANQIFIEPTARILYEIDCSQKMLRELSMDVVSDGKEASIRKPREWTYSAPETNSARLLKMLCPLQ